MKAKHLWLTVAVLLAAGGLWLGRSAWQTHPSKKSNVSAGLNTPPSPEVDPNSAASMPTASRPGPTPGPKGPDPGLITNSPARLAPPVPNRRFTDFTPEERVQLARQGHGPGG